MMLAVLLAATACQEPAPRDPKRGILTEAPDSLATLGEIRASLAGETAPGADAYSFRGFYAGMARARVEQQVRGAGVSPDSTSCHAAVKVPAELQCSYAAVLGPDHARLQLDVTYTAPAAGGERVARELTITRLLPLNVDGVQVAGALADAFEKQTTLLDSRDASYGRHQARIRMGTLNGARAHYADVTVASHSGREELTVKLGRGAGA
jgi:hypothetical protein